MEIEIDSVIYQSVDDSVNTCNNCVFVRDNEKCTQAYNQSNSCSRVIWAKKEEPQIKIGSPIPNAGISVGSMEKLNEFLNQNKNMIGPGRVSPEDKPKETGLKYSKGKDDYTLVPPYALQEVVRVLTANLKQYPDPLNYQKVPDAKQEFMKSLHRHLQSRMRGNMIDPDSLCQANELAAIIINAMFLLEFELNPNLKEVQ